MADKEKRQKDEFLDETTEDDEDENVEYLDEEYEEDNSKDES